MKKRSQFHSGRGAERLEHQQQPLLRNVSPAGSPEPALAFNQALAFHQAGRLAEAEQIYRQIIKAQPKHFDSQHLLGIIYSQRGNPAAAVRQIDIALRINPKGASAHNNRGISLQALNRLDEALASYDKALALKPDYAEAFYNRGNALKELKRLDEALTSYDKALALKPNYVDAFNNRANTLKELKRLDEALASYDKALALKPDYAEAFYNRANALKELKRLDEALASYDKALALKRDYAEAFYNRGLALQELKRLDEALASYEKVLALKPDHAEAFYNRGVALQQGKRLDEALASYEKAIAFKPDHADAFYNGGVALHELKRLDAALASYDSALALKPDHADALYNRGVALQELNRLDEAVASYDKALALKPDYVEALNNRGNALRQLKRPDGAVASYDKAFALKPDNADALYNRGVALKELKRLDEALASYDRALAVKPDHARAFDGAADCVSKLCDWDRRAQFAADLNAHVFGKKSIVSPFVLLGYSDDSGLKLQCARNYIEDTVPLLPRPFWTGETWRNDKLRVAYLSADFHRHAIAYLTAELFERHDRSGFEIIGASYSVDDESEIRQRIVSAFDQFYDVRTKTDEEVAKLLHELRVDIAIDLQGYTQDSRPGVLAYRPAPIQANYLGFPGTMGAEFVDYVIADRMVAPFEQQPFYTEKIVHLPDCYQVNDSKKNIAERTPTRQETGLPEKGFVFCCFNNNWKITPDVFSIWMRLLHAIEGSVLWLLGDNKNAEQNLRKQAQARGIDPSRLVFAGLLPLDEHLARHRQADLFLDTLPYNAHTTASDALWTGLPLVTRLGESFAGRVAASLLNAIGLPELVTYSIEDYEALALRLAKDSSLLEGYRNRLAANRLAHPLFDTDRSRRHIEAAYMTMWETWQRGEAPKSFSVERI
jgi:protein O-GlcNAc transferase